VLFADYSDPDVVRAGKDFLMVSSSFQNVPGLPILHSRDLLNWTIVGYAIEGSKPVGRQSSDRATRLALGANEK